VVGVVAQNKVPGSCQGRKDAKVGLVSRGEEEHGFHIEECAEGSLKLTVLGQIAGDQASRAGAKA
jgi:hypothetical protein